MDHLFLMSSLTLTITIVKPDKGSVPSVLWLFIKLQTIEAWTYISLFFLITHGINCLLFKAACSTYLDSDCVCLP